MAERSCQSGERPASEAREQSASSLLPMVYDELRAIAGAFLRSRQDGHTLQATALVNEAYLKLADRTRGMWESESHFKAVAARAMRQILIDHARGKRAQKRGGGGARITFDEGAHASESDSLDIVALHEALERLESLDGRKAQVVELRFFAGMTIPEAATALGVSHMTVSADWQFARAWLANELAGPGPGAGAARP